MLEIQEKHNKIFAPLKNKWLEAKPEEHVRQKYICRLVNDYGYDLSQMEQELQVTNSQRGTGAARADIVVWRTADDKAQGKSALIVIECKAEKVTIHEEDYFQGYNYAAWAGADFFVTTNLKETRIFKVVKGELPKRLEEIIDIPDAETAKSPKGIEKLLSQTKAFTRDEFSRLLFKCHNIIRNNDKLSPEAAFDEISKILFIKIRYERDADEGQIFSLERFQRLKKNRDEYNKEMGITDATPFYQEMFEKTKQQFADDHLFENNDKINIRENSFEQIVKELQIYNLSTTSDDVKGIAFEKFLGRTFRGELGQFFTPRTIVDFMVKVLDPQEGEYVCDPCCGSGGFLIRAFEYVREHIEEDIEAQKEAIKAELLGKGYEKKSAGERKAVDARIAQAFLRLNDELDINNDRGRLRTLSFDCIYGTDANPRMARTAKMNMIMHGDGHGGVHHNDGLLNVNGIFENRFDVILTNPPFGARVERTAKIEESDRFTDETKIAAYVERYGEAYKQALAQVNNHIGDTILSLYQSATMSTLTETLFIERCLRLLKPGGRLGIVLPEGVLNNSDLQRFREFVEGKAKILLIVSIPQDVFKASGATVKPSLVFFKKFTEEEAAEYQRITLAAIQEAEANHPELYDINARLALRGKEVPSKEEKAQLRADKRRIETAMAEEVKRLVKERFDYEIPIAEVEKAGISSTGAEIENELVPLEAEFTVYRLAQKLWHKPIKQMKYTVDDVGRVTRVRIADGMASESEVFYQLKL